MIGALASFTGLSDLSQDSRYLVPWVSLFKLVQKSCTKGVGGGGAM